MATRAQHASRPRRESLRKRLGKRRVALIAQRDGCRCVYCGATAESSGSHLHLDHLRPRSKGGEDTVTNLVTACRRCNCARQDMTVAQWAEYARVKLGLQISWRAIWAHARRAA